MPQVRLSQGTVHYQDTGGSGPTVVCVHGLLVNGGLWSGLRLDPGTRVVIPDLPLGSHSEAMRPEADLSPAGLARLVADFLAALELTDVTLIGNDTGGAICQLVAADRPERVGSLVLTNCDAYDNFLPPAFRPLQLLPRIPGGMALLARTLRLAPVRAAFGVLSQAPIPTEMFDSWVGPIRRDGGVRADATKVLRGITRKETQRAIAVLRDFDKPVLLAWGTGDGFFRPAYARRLAGDIPGARLEWIEHARTFVPLDAPEKLSRIVADFVSTQTQRSQP